jgi:hypothetical protein
MALSYYKIAVGAMAIDFEFPHFSREESREERELRRSWRRSREFDS